MWPTASPTNLLSSGIAEILTGDLFRRAFAFQASADTYEGWNPCGRCPYLRKTCFPCPVSRDGLIRQGQVSTCYAVHQLLTAEVLPEVIAHIEPDGSRGVVYNPLRGVALSLNKTAVDIFRELQAGRNISTITQNISERYNRQYGEVYEDVLRTIETFKTAGIARYRRITLDQVACT